MSGSLVDTSIYNTIKGPQPNEPQAAPNPLGMAQGLQQLQRTGLENNQMQQMQTAKMAIGQAAQNSIDPTTGTVDDNKFLANVAADPRSAYLANDMANSLAARKLQEANTSQIDLANGIKVADGMTQLAGTLYNDPGLTKDKAFQMVNSYLAMAPHSQALPIAINFVKNMPDQIEGPGGLRQYIGRAQSGFAGSAAAFKMASPDYDVVQGATGATYRNKNQTVLPQNAPLDGVVVGKGPTAEQLTSTSPVVGAGAVPLQMPNSSIYALRGGLALGQSTPGPLGSLVGATPPSAGPIPRSVAFPGAQPTGQNPGQGGWGQGNPPPSPAPSPQPATGTTGNPGKVLPMWDPTIPPGPAGNANPAAAIASGQPYQAELTPGQKQMQEDKAKGWQAGKAGITEELQGDQAATQAIQAEEKAGQLYSQQPGTATAVAWAQKIKAAANLGSGIPGSDHISQLADDIIKNPNDPQNGEKALAASQAWQAFALQTRMGLFAKNFQNNGAPGSEGEMKSIDDNYINNSTAQGAKQSIYDYAKQVHAYDLAKAKAAQDYENKVNRANATPDFNDFSTQWTQLALGHGFGSDTVKPNDGATISPPGNAQTLLQSVGLHPQAAEYSAGQAAAPQAGGNYVHGTVNGVTGTWEKLGGGKLKFVGQ